MLVECVNVAERSASKHPGRRGNAVSLAPLTPEQAISAIFKIKTSDVKRITAKRPGKSRTKRKKS